MPEDAPQEKRLGEEGARVGFNTAVLVFSRVASMALAFVQAGIILRALGRDGSGQFGAALAYSSLCTVFATLSIQRVLVRDIAREPNRAWTCVWSALALIWR